MKIVVQARAVHKIGIQKPHFFRFPIHQRDKLPFAPRDIFCKSYRGNTVGIQHHRIYQIFYRKGFTHLKSRSRRLGIRHLLMYRLGNSKLVIKVVGAFKIFINDNQRHHLCHGGRINNVVLTRKS